MAIYNKFLENKKGPEIAKLKIAVAAGHEYLTKCSSLEGGAQIKEYISNSLPKVEEVLQAKVDFEALKAAVEVKDAGKTFELGKKVLARDPNNIDVMLAVVSVGHFSTLGVAPSDKFNDDILRYAKTALEKLNDPKADTAYFKTTNCADGRINAIGWMNYVIGDLTLYRLKDRKAALPYLYKSTQVGCATRAKADAYESISATYFDEFQRLDADRLAKAKTAGDKNTEETDAIYALQLGYLDRMMDASGRTYNAAVADAKFDVGQRAELLAKIKKYYSVRHDENIAGFDDWLKGLSSKPFPDPTSKVEPVATPSPAIVPNKH